VKFPFLMYMSPGNLPKYGILGTIVKKSPKITSKTPNSIKIFPKSVNPPMI